MLRNVRERSFLIMGTRAKDNFTRLEKILDPILNKEKVFVPYLSAKWLSASSRSLLQKT